METQEKNLSTQESLRVIRETIDLAKHSFREDGFHFLLWGWLVAFASATDWYLAVILQDERHSMAWMIMTLIGVPVSLIREARLGKRRQEKNIVRKWYGLIWLGYGISMALAIPMSVRMELSPVPFILVLTGFATYISGILLKFRPLLLGAAVIWVGALWCMFLSTEQHLIVQAITAVLGYLVPGYLLNSQSKKHVSGA
jgi:hypothetical protein